VAQHATSTGSDPAILCLPRPREVVILSAHSHRSASGGAATRRIVAAAADQVAGATITGVGAEYDSLRDAHRSYQQALIAVRAAQFLPGLGEVVAWDSLGVYALLAKLDADDLDLVARTTPLARLAASRNGDVLLATAETFLDLAGSVQRTAEALHVHRATLYQRLARIEDVTGLHLDDGGDRLTLHLGIKLARLTGDLPD
jgi:sugar diacid utilization regulator